MIASTMAALKREPGKIVMVSSVTVVLSVVNFHFKPAASAKNESAPDSS